MIRISDTLMKTCLTIMLAAIAAWPAVANAAELHPPFALRDATGQPVVSSGMPVSTMQSCAGCHDVRFIAASNSHADALSIADAPMAKLPGSQAGRPVKSVRAEMNCFLCHLSNPDDEARRRELQGGRAPWSSTATLKRTGLVTRTSRGWSYRADAFTREGVADPRRLIIRSPTSDNCGLCHGYAHFGREPLRPEPSLSQTLTATTGQVFSPQRVADSVADAKGEEPAGRPWDVHAEKQLECIDCHHSINNPAFTVADITRSAAWPDHLRFKRREVKSREFTFRPSHQLASKTTPRQTAAGPTGALRWTMRDCRDCHDPQPVHQWLPAATAHLARLSCEACHIPAAHAPVVRSVDWTLPDIDGEPTVRWRGVDDADKTRPNGSRPLLLPREEADGKTRLGPYNLVAAWYWVDDGSPARPVRGDELSGAMFDGGRYRREIVAALDTNRNGQVEPAERKLDTPEKVDVVRRRLKAEGVANPRIEVELKPYAMTHGVVGGKWSVASCESCHSADSRLGEPVVIASHLPGDVRPDSDDEAAAGLSGRFEMTEAGQYVYRPSAGRNWLYVPGYSRWAWIDLLGSVAFFLAVVAVAVHGSARWLASRRHATDISDSAAEER